MDSEHQIEYNEEHVPYLVEHIVPLDSDDEYEIEMVIQTMTMTHPAVMKNEDVQGWISKGYKFVHLGQIDVLVKPHFKYELNAPYLISLLDVRHVDWKQALICQFTGELSKDGLCRVQPNFILSLQVPHLLQELSSEADRHIYMVGKKGKEVLITESESEPEEFECKSEFCNNFASASPYEIIQDNNSNLDNSTSELGSNIERGVYSDNEVPIAPKQQEKWAVSEKVTKALLDKGTIPINFWDFTPKNSLKNSKIK
ncbi:hypothetical protein EJ110_NYTH57863 [Nymphaea thermarum]|nr:hypothetical protein EJ110_NYTH57863 [Nymphaea thermarum]